MFGYRYKNESGAIIIDGIHVASTRQCVHCGNHERIVQGSGKKRGWCIHCQGFLCGKKPCMNGCTPFEARLEYQEALQARKIKVIDQILSRYPEIKRLVL